jgi:hypothetical protein
LVLDQYIAFSNLKYLALRENGFADGFFSAAAKGAKILYGGESKLVGDAVAFECVLRRKISLFQDKYEYFECIDPFQNPYTTSFGWKYPVYGVELDGSARPSLYGCVRMRSTLFEKLARSAEKNYSDAGNGSAIAIFGRVDTVGTIGLTRKSCISVDHWLLVGVPKSGDSVIKNTMDFLNLNLTDKKWPKKRASWAGE